MTAYSQPSRPPLTPLLLPLLLYIISIRPTPTPASTSFTITTTATTPHSLSISDKSLLSTIIITRLQTLANVTTTPPYTNRPYLSTASTAAQLKILQWMQQANLSTHVDPAGNVIGDLTCPSSVPRKMIMLGSHHDTVPRAGRFDGLYGVLSSISVAQILSPRICTLPFDIRVIAFDDEEGNNEFGTTNMGSHAYAGTVNWKDFNKQQFIKSYQALHGEQDPIKAISSATGPTPLAYLELHLEQGPVLEDRNKGVGVVDAIAGQTRMKVSLQGETGHTGTVPMSMRHDALTAASEGILAVESAPPGVVGTVGKVVVEPGVGNVIPGVVTLSVDIRSSSDEKRNGFVKDAVRKFQKAGVRRGVEVSAEILHDVNAVKMSKWLMDVMENVDDVDGGIVTSGAGHDAQIMASMTDVGMLFVRCRDGISHRPDEFVSDNDVFRGAKALLNTVLAIGDRVGSM